jgi:hypothetical protein
MRPLAAKLSQATRDGHGAQTGLDVNANAGVHLVIEGLHVLEVPEHGAVADGGVLRNLLGGGIEVAGADQVQDGGDDPLAGAGGALGAAVDRVGPGLAAAGPGGRGGGGQVSQGVHPASSRVAFRTALSARPA